MFTNKLHLTRCKYTLTKRSDSQELKGTITVKRQFRTGVKSFEISEMPTQHTSLTGVPTPHSGSSERCCVVVNRQCLMQ